MKFTEKDLQLLHRSLHHAWINAADAAMRNGKYDSIKDIYMIECSGAFIDSLIESLVDNDLEETTI